MKIRIGTRGSALALVQTRWVAERLRDTHPTLEIEEVPVRSAGDIDRKTPLPEAGGVGFFTTAVEEALLTGACDVAVHSLKDLPTTLTTGVRIAAVPERESPWDVWISDDYPDLVDLPAGARVATGSPRRRAQILHRYPHLEVIGIRGNIDTRLRTYREHGAAGLVLAEAGLRRTGRTGDIRATFGPTEMTPAPGQGALAVQVRDDDTDLAKIVSAIDHEPTRNAVTAERRLLAELEAGCHLPVGALGRVVRGRLVLLGMIADLDGKRLLQLSSEGDAARADDVALDLADRLLRSGGAEILAGLREEGP